MLPPATWTAIAVPMRLAGHCSASSALPTGCCGAPPTRDTTLAAAKGAKVGARAWRLVAAPISSPPEPSIRRPPEPPDQRPEGVLEQAAREAADGREEDDRGRGDAELVDDREVDQRVQRGLAVDQRVLDAEEAEGQAGSDPDGVDGLGLHDPECCMRNGPGAGVTPAGARRSSECP